MKKIESLRKMSKAQKLLLLTFVSLLLLSCAKDIIVLPPDTLRGFYIGRLFVKENYSYGGSSTEYMDVEWTFRDQSNECVTTIANGQNLNICDFIGRYELENGVLFSGTTTNIPETCNDNLLPSGLFSLRWINVDDGNDTLVLEQFDNSNDIHTWTKLVKQPDLEE